MLRCVVCCVGRHWAFRASQHSATRCAVPLGAGGAQCIRTLGTASQRSSSCPSIRRESATEPTPRDAKCTVRWPRAEVFQSAGSCPCLCDREGGSQWPGEQGRCQVSVKQTTGQSNDDGTRSRTKLAEENQRRIRAYVGPGTWTVERGRVGRGGIWDTIIRNGMGIVWRQNRLTEQTSKGRDSETWNKGPTRVPGACMRVRLRPRLV